MSSRTMGCMMNGGSETEPSMVAVAGERVGWRGER